MINCVGVIVIRGTKDHETTHHYHIKRKPTKESVLQTQTLNKKPVPYEYNFACK